MSKNLLLASPKVHANPKWLLTNVSLRGIAKIRMPFAAMEKRLAVEANSGVFDDVMEIDQTAGPVLDWYSILNQRLQKCKSKDGRHNTLRTKFDFGPNETEVLSRVVLEDSEPDIRAWGLLNLMMRNKDTDDSYFFDLIMTFLAQDPQKNRMQPNNIYAALQYLAPSPQTRDFLASELAVDQFLRPDSLGNVLRKNMEAYPELTGQVQRLCEDHFGKIDIPWKAIEIEKDSRSHDLYKLLDGIVAFGQYNDDFTTYVAALANGPMIDIAQALDASGWRFNRHFSSLLSKRHENRELAKSMFMQLIENARILERERGFMLDSYVGHHKNLGISIDDLRAEFAHILVPENEVLFKRADSIFSSNLAAIAKKEADQKAFVQRRERYQLAVDFVNFMSPFADPKESHRFLEPAFENCFERDDFNGITLFTTICSHADRADGRNFVITQDGRDRGAVSDMIDLSRTTLGLSPMDDVYPDDESYSLSVLEQYELYAKYLDGNDYCLVYIHPGWDDFSAIVISTSKKDEFCLFMSEKLSDLEYSFAGAA